MKRVKKRIFSGAVCEQIVYNIGDRADPKTAKPVIRFKDEHERAEHRRGIAQRRFVRKVNANFTPAGYFCTLTLDRRSECHTFDEARTVRRNYARRLLYKCPEAKIIIVMGRGHSTSRIHFHMFIEGEGITPELVSSAWKGGEVTRIEHLRAHNKVDGEDMGADFSAVARYCFEHWTEEQGGHYSYQSRNIAQPEEEEPTECRREYSPEKPPITPKGFKLASCTWNRYGYMIFKYVRIPEREKRRRKAAADSPCI